MPRGGTRERGGRTLKPPPSARVEFGASSRSARSMYTSAGSGSPPTSSWLRFAGAGESAAGLELPHPILGLLGTLCRPRRPGPGRPARPEPARACPGNRGDGSSSSLPRRSPRRPAAPARRSPARPPGARAGRPSPLAGLLLLGAGKRASEGDKLYKKAKALADPFAYEKYRAERVKQKDAATSGPPLPSFRAPCPFPASSRSAALLCLRLCSGRRREPVCRARLVVLALQIQTGVDPNNNG